MLRRWVIAWNVLWRKARSLRWGEAWHGAMPSGLPWTEARVVDSLVVM